MSHQSGTAQVRSIGTTLVLLVLRSDETDTLTTLRCAILLPLQVSFRTRSAKFRSQFGPKMHRNWTMWSKIWPTSAKFGQTRPHLVEQLGPTLVEVGTNVVELHEIVPTHGQTWIEFGRIRSNWTQFGPTLGDIVQFGSKFGRVWPEFDPFWEVVAQLG